MSGPPRHTNNSSALPPVASPGSLPAGPDFSLAGKVALLTGAGRGIGLGMARALASAGCAVAIQDIEPAVAREAADAIRRDFAPALGGQVAASGSPDSGARAIALGGDVADLSLAPRLVAETVRQLGGLHILVNNAATQLGLDWLELTVEQVERDVRADLIAPLLLAQAAVPLFRRQKWGRILNLGSIQQKAGNAHMLPYSMCKAALENMTKALARQYAGEGITVNLLAPGYFNTWRNRDDFPTPRALAEKGQYVPLGRIGEPADFAGITLLLCGEAGGYITGQSIYVDGGMSVR